MASALPGVEMRSGEQGWSAGRVGGLCGLLFATFVLLQNAVLLAGNPLPDAGMADIESFYRGGASRIAVAVGLVAVNVGLLVTFGQVVSARLETAQGAGSGAGVAGRVGAVGTVLLAGAFLVTTFLQAVLTARIEEIVAAGQLPLMWDLHTAAFAMSASSLAVVMGAFSVGSLLAGAIVPRWLGWLGLAGATCLLGAGLAVVPTLEGSAAIFLQLIGFGVWMLFVLVASARLLRGR